MTQSNWQPDEFDADDPERAARVRRTEEAMRAGGVNPIVEPEFEDYYNFGDSKKWYFPDGVSYIEYQPMNEGDRRKYQSRTKMIMQMNRASGDSKVGIDAARDREVLLDVSVKGWYMRRRQGGDIVEVPFTDRQYGWNAWVTKANPVYIADLESAIRAANPWMRSELSAEELRKERDELEDRIREAEAREEEKLNSSSK